MILTRLSSLGKLEYLDFAGRFARNELDRHDGGGNGRPGYLRLNLESGLDKLKSLNQLKYIYGPTSQQAQWDEAELQWIRKYWSRVQI